jgi:hypothetical protein
MKIINCVLILFHLFIFSRAQSQDDSIVFLKNIPEIKYGQLPYWNGRINNYLCFEHGFNYIDTINTKYNNLIKISLKDSKCFTIVEKTNQEYNYENLRFNNSEGCSETSFLTKNNSVIKEMFCPSLFAAAKSRINAGHYLVYFWEASFSESISYYGLIFDLNGKIKSFMNFDFWHVGFPIFPFYSQNNKIRKVDYAKRLATYLPNKLLLIKEPFPLEGGGDYYLYRINESGHFELCKSWTETGEIKKSLTREDKYVNLIRVDEEGNKEYSLLCFIVEDLDGYSNIRSKDSSSSGIKSKIKNGDVIFGTFLQNGWVKINFSADINGVIETGGYIHSSRLKNITDTNTEFILNQSENEWKVINSIY